MDTQDETTFSKELYDIEMELLHMDQERYLNIADQVEQLLQEQKITKRKMEDLEARNMELERMVEIMKERCDKLNTENMHLARRRDELSQSNHILGERNSNLEAQLHDELLWADQMKHSLENVLFDQDLLQALHNNEEDSQLDLHFRKD